jgi:predicted NACHT family NTPase
MESQLNFHDFDKFERKQFAARLTTVISNFYPFYNEAFVLSLNAKFGAGKTTFLKMWQNQLMEDGFTVIYFNAWETDFDDEPLIPIISALLDGIPTGRGIKELKAVLRGTLGTVVLAGNDFLEHISGNKRE